MRLGVQLFLTTCNFKKSCCLLAAAWFLHGNFDGFLAAEPKPEPTFRQVMPQGKPRELEFARCPAGSFERNVKPGDAKSVQKQTVRLSAFAISTTEIPHWAVRPWLEEYWNDVQRLNDNQETIFDFPGRVHVYPYFQGGDNDPAASLSLWGAKRFCRWLSLKTGKFYRLPTEAEWEYACRAGTTGPFPWVDPSLLKKNAWTHHNTDALFRNDSAGADSLMPVGRSIPNPWKIYDMIGNADEWAMDGYLDSYPDNARHDVQDPIVWPLHSGRGTIKIPFVKDEAYRQLAKGKDWATSAESPVLRGCGMLRGKNDEDYRCDVRFKYTAQPDYDNDPNLNDTAVYWIEDSPRIGFRLVCPEALPDPTIQLWHWGEYKEFEPGKDRIIEAPKSK